VDSGGGCQVFFAAMVNIMKSLPSERSIIDDIRSRLPDGGAAGLVRGIGDDCAVLARAGGLLELATTDTLVEGVHFDLAWHPAHLLGRKAVAVNVSDIAAMGGIPRYALLALGLPATLAKAWLDDLLAGFIAALAEYGVVLVGGDTVRSPAGLVLSVTVLGEVAADEVLYRHGASPGDGVWVSGCLGAAAAGLELCRGGRALPAGHPWAPLGRAHLDPVAQVRLGRLLATSGMVRAMMDLSDGLATDLAHLCKESGVGAEVDAACLPLADELRQAARELGRDPLDWALAGGEDYGLLFAAPADAAEKLVRLVAEAGGPVISRVGYCTAGSGVVLVHQGRERHIAYQGYDHFTGPARP